MTQRVSLFAKKNGGIDGLVTVDNWIAKSFDPSCSNWSGCGSRK